MPFILLIIGTILLIAAIRNTHGDLGAALTTDVSGFFPWALALGVIGGLGFVPGLKTPTRWLLALVLVVLVLKNYTNIFSGFTSLAQSPPTGTVAVPTPAQAYVANPAQPNITTAEVTGTSDTTQNVNAFAGPVTTSPFGAFDPAAFLTAFEQGVGGFGGAA
jgi:hypothetical protein